MTNTNITENAKKALETISNICANASNCKNCPFFQTSENTCIFNNENVLVENFAKALG